MWHVNMNVLTKTKCAFPKPTRHPGGEIERHPTFQEFIRAYNALVASETEEKFHQNLRTFQQSGKHPKKAVDYVLDTWITPYKEKIVKCWVNKVPHFGNFTTSVAEGSHASLKTYTCSSTGDLATVFSNLQLYWKNQQASISILRAQGLNKVPTWASGALLSLVRDKVVPQCLQALLKEVAQVPEAKQGAYTTPPREPCRCTIQDAFGLPCKHTLFVHLRDTKPLELLQVDRHWHWNGPEAAGSTADEPVRLGPYDPVVVRGKGRPQGAVATQHKKGCGTTGTRRLPSAFELSATEDQVEAIPSTQYGVPSTQYDVPSTYIPGTIPPRQSHRYMDNLENEPALAVTEVAIPEQFEGLFDEECQKDAQEQQEIALLMKEFDD
jgi:hypothetical protein